MATTNEPDWPAVTGSLLEQVRRLAPQVHVLTSTVAQPLSANLLLAVGAQPSMSMAPGEIEAFAKRTDALVANLGMVDPARIAAIDAALPILAERRRPWILDPVKVERSPARLALAHELIGRGPAVVRGNDLEMAALQTRAVTVRATTGVEDRIVLGAREVRISNGHPHMARVTAMGCAGTTLVGAFLAVSDDAFAAACAALLALGVAGEIAAERCAGPGSFPAAFLDVLHGLQTDELRERGRLT